MSVVTSFPLRVTPCQALPLQCTQALTLSFLSFVCVSNEIRMTVRDGRLFTRVV